MTDTPDSPRTAGPRPSGKKTKEAPFPTREEVAEFIRSSPTPVGKREIARAFDIRGDRRVALKALVKELERDGLVERKPGRGRQVTPPDGLPEVTVVEVVEIDEDGETVAAPAPWRGTGAPPRIFMQPERRGHPALDVGDRALVRLRRLDETTYEGRTIRRLDQRPAERVVGVLERRADGGVVTPADKRRADGIFVREADLAGARDGELVVVDLAPGGGPRTRRTASVIDRLGDPDHPRSISLIAIHAQGIPTEFPAAAVEEAEAATLPGAHGREDLRGLPLVTIDGADARDFDDAVFAEPDPQRDGGWHLVVAIADVAHYVPSGSVLDREALKRGNSCYFPDRVVPMLPEALSNGLCSLRPDEDRACVAAHLWIGPDGTLSRSRFVRGLMRSSARLTYEQVQAARNGAPDDATAPLVDRVIEPLYGAFGVLAQARRERGTLELDLPERTIELDDRGRVRGIGERARLDSHRLIEEFMILANVAAAQTLEARRHACLFRVHDSPDDAKVEALREFLEPLGYRLARTGLARPRAFAHLVESARGRPEAQLVAEMVLRAQAQAIYSPDNIGHFGLALPRYAHFTSPIRRYADLTVHRGLVRALGLGDGGSPDEELARLEEIGEHVSTTERRAAAAERDAADRYLASFLSARVGQEAPGRISGVTRFGLFVKLDETGADGLVPIASLPDDYYVHDERAHALVGRRWGRVFRLGARLTVRIVEADAVTGSTVFAVTGAALEDGAELEVAGAGRPPRPDADADRRGRPGGRRPGATGRKPARAGGRSGAARRR